MFFWNSPAFLMIQQMLAIWSLVPLPFLKPAWTSGSSWFTYCWSLAWRILNKRVQNAVLGCSLKNDKMISVGFQGKPFNITVIQVYGSTSNTEEAEVDMKVFTVLWRPTRASRTAEKAVCFIIGNWNAKVGSQEIPGVTGKFGLGVQSEAGQRLTEFC